MGRPLRTERCVESLEGMGFLVGRFVVQIGSVGCNGLPW